MTPARKAEIELRARTDAKAHQAGWPRANACPYWDTKSATEWRKAFDLALLEAKKK